MPSKPTAPSAKAPGWVSSPHLMDLSPGRGHGSSSAWSGRIPALSSRRSTCPRGPRHTCFITNARNDHDVPALELRHRGHARVEDRIQLEGLWLAEPAFASFTQNLAWVAASLIAGSLLAWSQMTCLDGELTKGRAESAPLPASCTSRAALVRRVRQLILRLDETWPWVAALQRAFIRLRTTFP